MGKKTTTTNTAPAKRAAKPAAKKTVVEAVAAKPKKAAAPRKRTVAKKAPVVTAEDIALRAYYLAEKRHAAGMPGDPSSDWIEAERQLLSEKSGRKAT